MALRCSIAAVICGVTWFIYYPVFKQGTTRVIEIPSTYNVASTPDPLSITSKIPATQEQSPPENTKPEEKVLVAQEWRDGERVITPQLAESMGSGSKFYFSGCIGKTITECINGATYAKTNLDGIQFVLGASREESCGPQARFLTVFGPKGFTTSGCWVKNGAEINLWIFLPKDSNGNYKKVSGPTVRSIEVMPYYKTHSLPEL
jgi:hypothetical protein